MIVHGNICYLDDNYISSIDESNKAIHTFNYPYCSIEQV